MDDTLMISLFKILGFLDSFGTTPRLLKESICVLTDL